MGWQTGKVRIELKSTGIRELLKSDGVAADVERRAQLVSEEASKRYLSIPVGARDSVEQGGEGGREYISTEVHMGEGANRARARVVADHPAAQAVEAADRVLGRSMDAAKRSDKAAGNGRAVKKRAPKKKTLTSRVKGIVRGKK